MVPGATPGTLEPDDWQPDAQADFEGLYAIEYAFDIAEYLEINFACAGVCKERLFWFAMPISDNMEDRPAIGCAGQTSKQL